MVLKRERHLRRRRRQLQRRSHAVLKPPPPLRPRGSPERPLAARLAERRKSIPLPPPGQLTAGRWRANSSSAVVEEDIECIEYSGRIKGVQVRSPGD